MTTKTQACIQAIPHILPGVSYMTAVISSLVSTAVGFGLGWYIKGRGMTGVQIDLNNVKSEVQTLKDKISGQVQIVA